MNKINKKRIFIINLILIILVFLAVEIYSYHQVCTTFTKLLNARNAAIPQKNKLKMGYMLQRSFKYSEYKKHFRSIKDKNNIKRPIILFGCSYTEGAGINDFEKTFAYILSKYTHRNVYNRGIGGTGPQIMYYQLNNTDIKKEIPDAEYIIYTFVDYHFRRLFAQTISNFSTDINLRYKIVSNHLEEIHPRFTWLYPLYTVKKTQIRIADEAETNEENSNYPLFKMIMKESFKKAKEKYPDAKFVILVYPSDRYIKENTYIWRPVAYNEDCKLPADLEKYLKNIGFIIINAEDLAGKKLRTPAYRVGDGDHPNTKAWQAIVPPLTKKLNL